MLPAEACMVLHSKSTTEPAGPLMLVSPPPSTRWGQGFAAGHAVFLFGEGFLVVLRWGLPNAANVELVRAGNEHERAVVLGVFGQEHRGAQGAHDRHPVLDMPGLEIRVPEELATIEGRLEVDARLMDVHIAVEDLSCCLGQAGVADEVAKHRAGAVDAKDRAHHIAIGLADHLRGRGAGVLLAQTACFVGQDFDLWRREQTG